MCEFAYKDSNVYKKVLNLGCTVEVDTTYVKILCNNFTMYFEIRRDLNSFVGFYGVYLGKMHLNYNKPLTEFNEVVMFCLEYFENKFLA